MKIQCAYCHKRTTNSGKLVKMCCMCDDEHRILHIEDVLLGIHSDKVYTLNEEELTPSFS